jgi:hypothetical protein
MFSTSKSFFKNPSGGGGAGAIAISSYSTPYITAYPWSSGSGFGARYANPSSLPTPYCTNVTFNYPGTAIAVSYNNSPFLAAYPWSAASGFGAKYTNPVTLPNAGAIGRDIKFHPANTAVAMVYEQGSSPYLAIYNWSDSGFGTKLGAPAQPPVGWCKGVKFNPAGSVIAIVYDVFPFISAYTWSASGFQSKFTNPAPQIPDYFYGAFGVDFNPAGTAVAISYYGTPGVQVHAFSSATGFGTKYADPATPPQASPGYTFGVVFNPAGNSIAVSTELSPFVYAYPWSNATGFGTKYANPANLTAGTFSGGGVAFSSTGNDIALAQYNSPYVSAYPWSAASGFGTKYTAPVGMTINSSAVAFSL